MQTRLNKYIADRGICSRRKADELIASGHVFVNEKRAELGSSVTDEDVIKVNGKIISAGKPKPVYIAFNKPVGLITSMDPLARDNVIQYINHEERIFPVGRLDVASSGLLLLTNDGVLSEAITHPRNYHEKEYIVSVHDNITDESLKKMATGLVILGKITKPATVKRINRNTFSIILTEGRNRQIRRMCAKLGHEVKSLHRIRVMNVQIGNLKPGAWRNLSHMELLGLKKSFS